MSVARLFQPAAHEVLSCMYQLQGSYRFIIRNRIAGIQNGERPLFASLRVWVVHFTVIHILTYSSFWKQSKGQTFTTGPPGDSSRMLGFNYPIQIISPAFISWQINSKHDKQGIFS